MAKYRKKPIVIEAFMYGYDPMPDWFMDAVIQNIVILHNNSDHPLDRATDGYCIIKTLEGDHKGLWGEYIIQGVQGEIYPCKADIFQATYELVEGDWK